MEENLHKWLNQEASSEEEAQLRSQEGFEKVEAIVRASEQLEVPAFDKMVAWNQLKEKHASVDSKVVPIKSRRRPIYWIGAAAAVLALFLVATQMGLFDNRTTVTTLAQQKEAFQLPDGSYVTLNAGSQVKYNEKTFAEKRIIELAGEAYFVVKRGGGFLVKTDEGLVRVLGTNFNVYAREDGFAVDCYIGKVEARNEGQIIELTSGKAVEWDGSQFVDKRNVFEQPKWIDVAPESIYYNVPLSKVVREVERQFGLEIELDIKEDYLYRGGFPHDDLQQAMDNITEQRGLRYEQDGTKMRIWEE